MVTHTLLLETLTVHVLLIHPKKSADPSLYRLESLTLPSTVNYEGETYEVITIESKTLYEESLLTKLVISDTIRYIYSLAFYNSKITEITFGSSVETIDNNAFLFSKRIGISSIS